MLSGKKSALYPSIINTVHNFSHGFLVPPKTFTPPQFSPDLLKYCKEASENICAEIDNCLTYLVLLLPFDSVVFLILHQIQRRIQSPVKHLRWNFLRKQLIAESRIPRRTGIEGFIRTKYVNRYAIYANERCQQKEHILTDFLLFVQSSNTPVRKTVDKVELAKEVMELQKQIEEKDAEIEELRKE